MRLRAIDRKLFRDLWHMRGQALAIAMVIASGVATYVMSLSTLDSLQITQRRFYQEHRFAEVFASLKRAPNRLEDRIREIPGVQAVQTRVAAAANLTLDSYDAPVTGLLLSVPDTGEAQLNQLFLRRGRQVDARRDDEVLVHESFATAHKLEPGDRLRATINGKQRRLTVVGIVLSPEYVYQIQPGGMIPDFEGYGILWMARTPLGAAYDMDGAFNDVAVSLAPRANPESIIDQLDALLKPYGGLGAYTRQDQLSHRYLHEEFRQLEQMATMFPTIFLGVAAFLLNVVLNRLISTQREQIAALKAFGYSNWDVGVHYTKFVLLVIALGAAAGVAVGVRFGRALSAMYQEFYRFPALDYVLEWDVAILAGVISGAAALVGTLFAVRRAASLPPAEAMRPEPPAHYRESLVERMGLKRFLSQPTRMIVRSLERRPLKALLSIVGISMACAILTMSFLFRDSVDFMVHVQFGLAQREDIAVTFVEPTSYRALYELAALDGVLYAEPFRSVPVRLRSAHRTYRTTIQGVAADSDVFKLLDEDLAEFPMPPEGVILTDYLGDLLGLARGDLVTVEVLEGNRPVRRIPIAGFVKQFLGVGAYMDREALNRVMREAPAISGAYLVADDNRLQRINDALREMGRVAGTSMRAKVIANFYETTGGQVLTFAFFTTLFAGTIAFGVVYNSARISLSERGRELASLRVLGLTRGEISFILLGELAILTLLAIPLGFVLGRMLAAYMLAAMQTDLFRIPLVLQPSTYAFAATVVLLSALVSGFIVRRRLDRLDLVAVLKTRE